MSSWCKASFVLVLDSCLPYQPQVWMKMARHISLLSWHNTGNRDAMMTFQPLEQSFSRWIKGCSYVVDLCITKQLGKAFCIKNTVVFRMFAITLAWSPVQEAPTGSCSEWTNEWPDVYARLQRYVQVLAGTDSFLNFAQWRRISTEIGSERSVTYRNDFFCQIQMHTGEIFDHSVNVRFWCRERIYDPYVFEARPNNQVR